jgi:hypothetical protein
MLVDHRRNARYALLMPVMQPMRIVAAWLCPLLTSATEGLTLSQRLRGRLATFCLFGCNFLIRPGLSLWPASYGTASGPTRAAGSFQFHPSIW